MPKDKPLTLQVVVNLIYSNVGRGERDHLMERVESIFAHAEEEGLFTDDLHACLESRATTMREVRPWSGPSVPQIVDSEAEDLAWDTDSNIHVLCRFIEENHSAREFRDFVRKVAQEERDESNGEEDEEDES